MNSQQQPQQQQNGVVNRPHTSVSYKISKNKIRVSGVEQESPQLPQSQQSQNNAKKSPTKLQNNNILPDINKKNTDKSPYTNFLKSKQNDNINVMSVNDFQDVLLKEKDERFRYLLKHGTLKRIEGNGNIIFCELPQIPGIWVCYRRPMERENNLEKLNLDYMELLHIPLLEGEEKLKILTYQHNRVIKIENLVSLPTLLYIDLYDNLIKEIENLNAITQLRVLLLPKNQITKIKNLEGLSKLEVLDLHSNKIQKIEGISKLPNLRILNLANNLLIKIENLENQFNLVELNLKINLIEQIENINHLTKLEKLFISNNRISDCDCFLNLKNLTALAELNCDGNPISKLKIEYAKNILLNTKNLQILDHRNVETHKDEIKIEESKLAADKKKDLKDKKSISSKPDKENENKQADQDEEEDENINPEEVIEIIGQQWQKELERVKQLDMQNLTKKEILRGTQVEGGHAEIEDDSILFIFGNAYEIVLSNPTFQEQIEKIQFQFILFDFLIETNTLQTLKNFRKLKEIVLKDNYVSSLLQLAKLEILPSLRFITLENSPLCKCSFLKEFIVYRFPHITKINGKDVKEMDKQRAKQLFHHFDRILQLPEKFYNVENVREFPYEQQNEFEVKKDKHYMKLFTKLVNENAEQFTQSIIPVAVQNKLNQSQIDNQFDQYAQSLVVNILKQSIRSGEN